jgi:hypothetical protein
MEPKDAIAEISGLCSEESWKLATWNIDEGLKASGAIVPDCDDPLAAVKASGALGPIATSVLVLENFHRFMSSAEVIQALISQIHAGKNSRSIIVILSHVTQLPIELEKLFVVVEHQLPDREQLEAIARGIATEDGELPESDELDSVMAAAAGLTRLEAENAFSLSIVRNSKITKDAIWELKSRTLKKSGLMRLYHGQEDFDSLGGLEGLKQFTRRSLLQSSNKDTLKMPRGILLLGVSGTGKSAFAKALGRESGRPTLVLDIGNLMGSLVGETEQNVRRALRIADAMAPCVLFIDELEKSLGGSTGSAQGDSGIASRLLGTLLSYMNDHTSSVYIVATCNDISKLPPELTRAERLDGIYFLDLPGHEQKDQIWRQYIEVFGLDDKQKLPNDSQWTGAEIRSCCRLAAMMDTPLRQAAVNIIPVAKTSSESVEGLRQWASGRCLDADRGGVYQAAKPKSKSRRKVNVDPSLN